MAFPPPAVAADKTNATTIPDDHPDHHNALANAVNDIVTEVVAFESATATALAGKASAVALSSHEADTTNIHGIADTSALETTTGAQSKADAKVAQSITDGVTTSAPSQDVVFDALALKAPLASPSLTGNPTAPTQTAGNNSTRVATTAYVDAVVSDTAYDATTWDAVTGIAPSKNAVRDRVELLAPKASPTFTGTVVLPADQALTGNPTVPNQAAANNSTRSANTAYVDAIVSDTAYDASTWNGVTGIAPSKNAVRDQFQKVRAAFARYVVGNITMNSNVWANMPSIGTATVAAAVGDILEASINIRLNNENVAISMDVVTEVSASPVNSFGTGASAPGVAAGWIAIAAQAVNLTGGVMYTVQSGDISGGNVTCRWRYIGASATNRTATASATQGIHLTVKNLGPA